MLKKIKAEWREFVSARKRIVELENRSLLQNNAELWHDNVSSFAHIDLEILGLVDLHKDI